MAVSGKPDTVFFCFPLFTEGGLYGGRKYSCKGCVYTGALSRRGHPFYTGIGISGMDICHQIF